MNLYGFVDNDVMDYVDTDGRDKFGSSGGQQSEGGKGGGRGNGGIIPIPPSGDSGSVSGGNDDFSIAIDYDINGSLNISISDLISGNWCGNATLARPSCSFGADRTGGHCPSMELVKNAMKKEMDKSLNQSNWPLKWQRECPSGTCCSNKNNASGSFGVSVTGNMEFSWLFNSLTCKIRYQIYCTTTFGAQVGHCQ